MSTRTEPAPIWQPDSDTKTCTLCSRKFTFWFRRHHCRKCGKVVCRLCSSTHTTYEITTPILEAPGQIFGEATDMPHRTCDVCVEEIIANTIIRESETQETDVNANEPVQIPSIVAKRRSRYIKDQTRQRTLDMGNGGNSEEEDENDRCPVCFTIIKHLDEQHREEHINMCLINLEFRGSPDVHNRNANRMLVYNIPGNEPTLPQPQQQQQPALMISDVLESPASSPENIATASSSSQLLTSSVPQSQEKLYLHEESPNAEECVICLEEFQPGDKVGRLECLCVFHYECIKSWFKKKGPGDCPIHAIHLE
ncbi:hypothetical protein WICPIJ_006191 [Wickerhamomyces pijperi]|uniref:RING-type E3 ubiquitin transferase n=1 Tax=Wickerhamomyces pijperi TaxID=599730 RepID=A0A9P8Q2Q4_WICPI|nr:hypothetical protein WICPIJ_006191 [Wickerhamomyces pijperi]